MQEIAFEDKLLYGIISKKMKAGMDKGTLLLLIMELCNFIEANKK